MRALAAVAVMLAAACASRQAPQREDPASGAPGRAAEQKPAPEAAPAQAAGGSVRGGEEFTVDGARVRVVQVTYVNEPCPKDVQCVHSGVIKSVRFHVERAGEGEEAVVAAGTERVVRQVLLRVLDVVEGPQASVEIQAAVMPKRLPLKPAQ